MITGNVCLMLQFVQAMDLIETYKQGCFFCFALFGGEMEGRGGKRVVVLVGGVCVCVSVCACVLVCKSAISCYPNRAGYQNWKRKFHLL